MDQKLVVDALGASIASVFSTMLGLEVDCGAPYEEVSDPAPNSGLIGLIGMAGAWVGTVTISCNASMGCHMASQMLGTQFPEVGEEVLDAVSEIINMIVGGFKTEAEPFLGPLGLSIPAVIYGLNYRARTPGREKWTVLPFSCGSERILVRIRLTPNRGLLRLVNLDPERVSHR